MHDRYDYVIVGSGAGGGTLAARLAEAGMTVCVLEAGDDALAVQEAGLPEDYQVPAFHAFATENHAMAWNCRVDHGSKRAESGSRSQPPEGGFLYPRAATLGGCTAHNAMIFMRPHDSDWNDIARLTGDRSWRARAMNRYFQRVESCRHRPLWRLIAGMTGFNPTGHGWKGWLPVEVALPREVFRDDHVLDVIRGSARTIWRGAGGWIEGLLSTLFWALDPNNYLMVKRRMTGMFTLPLSTNYRMRYGTRERLQEVAVRHPERLHIELNALATRVILNDGNHATGVEYLKGKNLYGTSAQSSESSGETRIVQADREVILAGGAFNTPQILMLSGIGRPFDLQRHGIEVRVDLPGVGRNLQDRYEIAVINRVQRPWTSLEGACFRKNDEGFHQWKEKRAGIYISNGALFAFTQRSAGHRRQQDPDLLFMALPTRFHGYFPRYSDEIRESRDHLTWTVLKAHTLNRAGTVTLRSADPCVPPLVNFRYFEEGSDVEGKDLRAVVEGVRVIRRITDQLREAGCIGQEELPGEHIVSDAALAEYVRDNAWGHHASCSCAIGARETDGVLSSDFRVHGTRALRVVDASVFPRIPGFFLAGAIFMIAEKAADVILEAAQQA